MLAVSVDSDAVVTEQSGISGFGKFMIILLVFGLIGALGYFGFKYWQKNRLDKDLANYATSNSSNVIREDDALLS